MKHLMLLLLGLAVGGLTGHLVTLPPHAPARLDRDAAGATALPAASAGIEPMSDPKPSDTPDPSRDLAGAANRAPSEIARTDDPTPRGVITGTIHSTTGEPIAGAVVIAEPASAARALARRDSPPPLGSLKDHLERARAEYERRLRRREATSDERGHFRVEGVEAGAYRVEAWAKDHAVFAQDASVVVAGSTVRFTARPMAALTVDIVVVGGAPVRAATLTLQQGRDEIVHEWTPASKTCWIGAGEITCRAITDDARETDSVRVTLASGGPAKTVRLEAAQCGSVYGRVDGALSGGEALVWWMPWSTADAPDRDRMLARATRLTVTAQSAFAFRIPSLAAGTYAVGAGRSSAGPDVIRVVTVAEQPVEAALTVPPADAEHYVRVRVRSAEGHEIDVPVVATIVEHGERTSRSSGFECVAPGVFLLPHPPRESDEARCFVEAIDRDGVSVRRPYRPGRDAEVVLQFAPRAEIEVMFACGDRELRERVELWISSVRTDGDEQVSSSRRLEVRDGVGTIHAEPGRYEIAATVNENHGQREIACKTVHVAAGRNQVRLDVPPLHELIVHGPPNGIIVLVDGSDNPIDGGSFDAKGRKRLRWLEAGTYALRDQVGTMPVRVPAGGPVTFAPRPMNAVEVSIDDAAGPLARLGFRDGDVIVGANGKRFATAGEFNGAFGGAGATALMVERSGRALKLMFDPNALGGESMGGAFKPVAR